MNRTTFSSGFRITLSGMLLLIVSFTANAQIVDVQTGSEPKVPDADKINENPVIRDTFKINQEFDYQITSKESDAPFKPDTISAAKMKSEPLAKLHRFYLKAGFGNYLTPLVDFSVNSLRHRKDMYAFRYKHLSSGGKISDKGYPGLSDNEGYAMYSHIFKNHTIILDAEYRRNVVHYYNYHPSGGPDTNVVRDSTRQRFSRINFNANFFSAYRTDSIKWNHRADLDFYHMIDRFGTMENHVRVSGEFNKFTDLFAKEFMGSSLTFQWYNYKNDSVAGGNNGYFLDLNPYMQLGRKKWGLRFGVNLALGMDDSVRFNVYPDVRFHWNIYRNYIMFYTNFSGKYERQSFLRLSQQNPFLMSTARLANLNQLLKVEAGVKGSFTDNISYNTGVAFSLNENLAYFANDTSNFQRRGFDVLYRNTNWLQVFGELAFTWGEKLSVTTRATYNGYYLSLPAGDFFEPWHRPFLEGTVAARYNIGNKLIFTADFYFISPQKARIFVADTANPGQKIARSVDLNGAVDLNLGAEYRLTKMLSFWVNFNNFAAWRYNRWYGYPTQQFNVIGGLTFAL